MNGGEAEPRRTPFERISTAIVASRAGAWFYVNVAPHLDRVLIPLTRGRVTTGGRRVGLLKVRGAKSGVERRTPLVYARDGDKILLTASRGGDRRHPAWYHNLVANPNVTFTSGGGGEAPYRARKATADERPRLWRIVNRRYSGYEIYQRRAGEREIPVVVLEPRP